MTRQETNTLLNYAIYALDYFNFNARVQTTTYGKIKVIHCDLNAPVYYTKKQLINEFLALEKEEQEEIISSYLEYQKL